MAKPAGDGSQQHRAVWLTDPHFNFVDDQQVLALLDEVNELRPDSVLISGDFSESSDVLRYLSLIDETLAAPVYFVLGNHDFYFSSILQVRAETSLLCRTAKRLHYLTRMEPIELAPGVGLVGHDGWADARVGDYERSYVMMNDYRLIKELAGVGKKERLPMLRALGEEAGAHIGRVLESAAAKYPQVLLATHVPPLREACWHAGQISDDEWSPHFTCLSVGEAILEVMQRHPDCKLTVLCGHTHGDGECRPAENVRIITGGAEYGEPKINRVLQLPGDLEF